MKNEFLALVVILASNFCFAEDECLKPPGRVSAVRRDALACFKTQTGVDAAPEIVKAILQGKWTGMHEKERDEISCVREAIYVTEYDRAIYSAVSVDDLLLAFARIPTIKEQPSILTVPETMRRYGYVVAQYEIAKLLYRKLGPQFKPCAIMHCCPDITRMAARG